MTKTTRKLFGWWPFALGGAMGFAVVHNAGAAPTEKTKAKAEPKAEAKAKPPSVRQWTVRSDAHATTFGFEPAVGTPGEVHKVLVLAHHIPEHPHPRFGRRIPVENAEVTVTVTGPRGRQVQRHRAHALPGSKGLYGFHFSPPKKGRWTISAEIRDQKDRWTADAEWPVAVWPWPEALQGNGAQTPADRLSRTSERRPITGTP